MKYLYLLISLITMALLHAESIVHLKAPIISEKTILKHVTCTRPKRQDGVNISYEQIDQKQVVHCYGHSGFGWSTLFGSINHAIEIFERNAIDLKKPICVVGSGCIGLVAAIELVRRGYTVSKIVTKDLYDLCSWRAPGCFALDSSTLLGPDKEMHKRMTFETFSTFKAVDAGTHPYLKRGSVKFLPVYCMNGMYSGFEPLETEGLIPQREMVTLDFGNGVRHENFVKFRTYFMDTAKLMQQLHDEVARLGITIQIDTLFSFNQVNENIIFNCTGLGSKELNNDTSMTSVRGHLLLLNEQAGLEHMNYLFFAEIEQKDKKEFMYMFPKSVAVSSEYPHGIPVYAMLGGTFLSIDPEMTKQALIELDEREFNKLTDRLSLFFTGKPFSKV